jgi:hypothetical protein
MKSSLKSGDICYLSVQDICLLGFLSKYIKFKVYRNIMLRFRFYISEISSLILFEERRLKLFENRALRKMFVLKRSK